MRILKGLFKQLDPAIIHTPHEIHGQVQLSFKYDVKRQLLLVKLIKCNNLQAGDLRTKASAPYAKVDRVLVPHCCYKKTRTIVHQ